MDRHHRPGSEKIDLANEHAAGTVSVRNEHHERRFVAFGIAAEFGTPGLEPREQHHGRVLADIMEFTQVNMRRHEQQSPHPVWFLDSEAIRTIKKTSLFFLKITWDVMNRSFKQNANRECIFFSHVRTPFFSFPHAHRAVGAE